MSTKLKWLNDQLSQFELLLMPYLKQHGISRSHVQNYLKSGWLEVVVGGVYKKPNATISWSSALSALQYQQASSLHLSGLSSLAQQGISHYLAMGSETIHFNSIKAIRLPKWLFSQHWKIEVKCSKVLDQIDENDLIELAVNSQTVKASVIELAVLEMLEKVTDESSFIFAVQMFQGFTSLRPRKLQSLLERSPSMKVKRLFLFLAQYYQHPWFKRIDESKLALGSGNRQIVKGGYVDKRYLITVPIRFKQGELENG
ncbi:type IV toxin-antitoxin system AbiEi family antitoxin [Colwellia sp. KU-HH00111]|uniref:type IV toxin-antitoxin system AbiEi family antitoxin domain-containing protein n=1 Tax=Colwellia sp. KU-HH00111 TaxID=3127652 RepID=UPI0031064966